MKIEGIPKEELLITVTWWEGLPELIKCILIPQYFPNCSGNLNNNMIHHMRLEQDIKKQVLNQRKQLKTVWIVSLFIHFPGESSETYNEGGYEKQYAVFSNKGQADEIREILANKSDDELIKLKIIKPKQSVSSVIVSHPYTVDNYEAIFKKLTT